MAGVSVSNPPIPQSPLIDQKSGQLDQAWYQFLYKLWARTGGSTDSIYSACPIGTPCAFAGSVVPDTFLLCDGSAVSRATYSDLFSAIGITWGAGDGSTTFNVPDFRGRVLVGAGTGSGLTPRVLGT